MREASIASQMSQTCKHICDSIRRPMNAHLRYYRETLAYWVQRLEPLLQADSKDEIIVVFCNRCGVEDDTVYAGTSAVLGIEQGVVKVYGILGRCEQNLLIVDTDSKPLGRLVTFPEEAMRSEPPHGEPTDI